MRHNTLGWSDLGVSEIRPGTMTWGEQNAEAEANRQLDYVPSCGINFVDAAEMYPVPPRAETQGRTEALLGRWLRQAECVQLVKRTFEMGLSGISRRENVPLLTAIDEIHHRYPRPAA